ncbi:hypothetical protein [Effusibacillus lacus]|uniref:Uncharacterized protein n=1 Tax=Effusibacillus lacus TaxID=1348429 RepID=A0A292YEC5_9BACL|nr:hypothetical protein [Effusibacillus lacus]TCS76131.1 hypothetical protein EDD64_104103 [Effusibacillus lacus]GAX91362.1 hypothetical protein EFBL_3031 [Effusibacillus lacus]
MKKRTAVRIQCQNPILYRAIQKLLDQIDDIKIVHGPSNNEEAESEEEIDFVIREEDELIRTWASLPHDSGISYVYVNPKNNCITVITRKQVELSNADEFARLIVQRK